MFILKNKEYISPLQFYFIIVGFILGTSIILSSGIDILGRDIWIPHVISIFIAILILLMMFYIVDKYPQKESFQILEEIFGKIISKIFLLIFLLFSIFLSGLVLDNIGELMVLMVMQHTNEWTYILTMSIIASFILSKGIEVSSRCIQIGIGYSMISYLLIIILLAINVDYNELIPIFSNGLDEIFRTTLIVSSFPYIEIIFVFFLIPNIKKNDRKKALKLGIIGIITGGLLLIVIDLLIIGTFGEKEAGRILYTTYEVVRMVSLDDFFERIEIFILWIWFVTTYSKFTICLYGSLKCIQGIFKLEDYKKIAIPIGILLVPIGTNAYRNYEEIATLTMKTWQVLMIFIFLLLAIVFICSIIKKHIVKSS